MRSESATKRRFMRRLRLINAPDASTAPRSTSPVLTLSSGRRHSSSAAAAVRGDGLGDPSTAEICDTMIVTVATFDRLPFESRA